MNNINVFIIEDTPAESNRLVKFLEANSYSISGVAKSFREALILFHKVKVDIVIIDVFLNGSPDGIAFAEMIQANPETAKPFVFLTNSVDRQLFLRAKLTRPYSYLMKPFNELEILYAIEMAVSMFYTEDNTFLNEEEETIISENYVFIKKGKSLKKVHINDVIFIEVEEKYCSIVTAKEKFVISISLTKILKLLDNSLFCRTHRNFIVNIEKIEEIIPVDNLIILDKKHKVPLSEKYRGVIKKVRTLK
ncbi:MULTISPECIES: LytR/AlgR family response regulator transcription factor [Tenacibaculum]|uniref:LytR/AlgR family response regulator transcription factor n=1 Tax=Tenacibaculum TaxID=104267 RepID=UPI000896B112|nr:MULTISPECIES: response regulator transcription factor [unclassified Tenacibaculum]RBW57228.1 DNA-binding response regulator [Tenacibaculum sp. E3R01]SEE26105.1 DNA-binding response regulator, LytR/AlgR family [Tenacibaculum sp. MAR_2010_89]